MTDNQATILRLLERHPGGITQADLVLTTGLTPHAITMSIRALHRAYLAAPTQAGGPRIAWATPENCAVLKAEIARNKDALAEEKRVSNAEHARTSLRRKKEAETAAVDSFARPSIRRTVTQWDRPAAREPFSVFNQGASV